MDNLDILVAMATFLAVASLVVMAGRLMLPGDERVDNRLDELQKLNGVSAGASRIIAGLWRRNGADPKSRRSSFQIMPGLDDERARLQARLMHAGIYAPSALSVLLVIKAVLMMLPPVIGVAADALGLVQDHLGLYLGAAGGVLGLLLPGVCLDRLKRRRHSTFNRSLPDFLDLLVACLEAGMSIEASLQRVADELQHAHPLLGGEMKAVQTQIELGATPEVALRNLGDRSDFEPLRTLSTVVLQARRFGTGVSDSLRQHANGLRVQREQVAEERAQNASVQILIPTMLLIFPAIFVVLAGPAAIKLSESFSARESAASSRSSSGGFIR